MILVTAIAWFVLAGHLLPAGENVEFGVFSVTCLFCLYPVWRAMEKGRLWIVGIIDIRTNRMRWYFPTAYSRETAKAALADYAEGGLKEFRYVVKPILGFR